MSLVPQWRIGALRLTDFPFSVRFGADHGAPDSSAEVLASFLFDGDLELTSRVGNRTLTLPIMLEASDMAAMSQWEAALVEECDKPLNTLTVDPGDGYGESYQFTVFRGSVVFERDDDFEQAGVRLYTVTWRASPWPESTKLVTDTLSATSVGTAAQRVGTFPIRGAVASRGSLSVQHASQSLGHVLVYTCPDDGSDYVPACRQHLTLGSGTTAGGVAGFYDKLGTGGTGGTIQFEIPADDLPPGEYAVAIKAQTDAIDVASVRFSVAAKVDGNVLPFAGGGGPNVTVSGLDLSNLYFLGMAHLPPADMPTGSLSKIRLSITNDASATSNIDVEEAYLFNVSKGRLSRFFCDTGTPDSGGPASRLWLDSPGVENDGLGRYVMGTLADRSDAYSALLKSIPSANFPVYPVPSVHEFPAIGTKVFVLASGVTTAPTITYQYRPAGHSSVYTGT